MGRVYRARQTGMDRAVALKVLLPDLAANEELVARFHREMRATTAIEHPNTVRVYDYGTAEDGQLFLALEFLEGTSLDDVIADDAPMKPERVAHIARGIARALAAAHHHGIVHRDLKPENVMLVDRYGRGDFVKVLDFGLARITETTDDEALTALGTRVGSPMYMAPEYVDSFAVSPSNDLYALGVLMYQMATGRTPFRGRPHELLGKHLEEIPAPPSKYAPVPQWLEELIQKLLAKTPEERPQLAEEVVKWLEKWSPEAEADIQAFEDETGKQAPAEAPSLLPTAGRDPASTAPSTEQRLLWMFTAAIVVLGLLGLGLGVVLLFLATGS